MLTMKDMALKMANNETQSRSQIEEYWSEHFLSKFGLEYIKYDILIKKRECKNKDILKERAIQKIAQVLHIEANENNIMNMCIKFRQEILLLLRCVVRQCFLIGWDMKEKWQMDFALLLMPPWLRTVEMELVMLPQAVLMEYVAVTAETAVTTRFKVLLEEGGSVVFPRWDTFDAGDFKKVSAYYNISRTEARDVWSGMCSKSRQRIMQEVQCREGSREVNFEVTDLLLLHDLTFRLVTPESLSKPKQLQKLTTLYQCVLKRNVENVLRNERPRLLEVWMQVLAEYPFSMGFSSVVYIQRQWYELKQLARSEVLAFHLQQPRPHHHPHPLLLSIVANFRHIVQEPLPKWSEFVTSKMVVKFKDITKTLSKKVLEGWMDELIKATEQSGIQNKSLQKHVCIVQPLNSNKNIIKINKETQTNTIESNKLMENTSNENNIINQNINDKESQNLNKSDLNIDNMNECVASIHSSVANKKNIEGNIDFNVFNNIDPSKAKKCFIFDSDSDSETLSAISLHETDRQTFQTELNSDMSQTSEDSKVLDWFKENGEKSKQIKENLQSKIDPKLRKEITIPLIRCDEIPAWKKYYKNNTININNIKNELCSLKYKNKKINTSKILKRQTRSNNFIYYDLNINCEGLSENFLRNKENKLLFKLCKRLSVNLQRFTHEQRTLCRRRKKIQLADIEEVRKINSTILTAEVAPVSITKCDPPSEGDFGILSDESMIEVTNYNVIDALELDELFNKLPVPSLTSINLDKPTETTNIATGHDNINSEQNKTNSKEENYEDLNKKILYIIMNGPRPNKIPNKPKSPVTTVQHSSDSTVKLCSISEKRKKRQNPEKNTHNQTKKKRKRKSKNPTTDVETKSDNAFEEWDRQKNMNKKYFQLPNIAPKPADSTKSNNTPKDDISLPTENTYINKYIISINKKKPTLPTSDPKPIIDLTNDSDDTQFDIGTTPIITSVYSLATQNKQVERPSRVITPILIPQNNINTDLATITKVQSNVGSLIIQNTSDGSALVPVSLAGQQIYVQQSAQAQCTTDAAGRRFLILPKSHLLNGNSSLLLPKVNIGNASLTCNPVDHIQKMIAPTQGIESEPQPLSLMPWVPLDLWAQGKCVKELVLLQIDASKPAWTLTGGQAVVTLTDYTCESPIYCSLPAELKTRIMFPQENNGMEVYNPPTLQIYEDAANGTTSFAKWVKSVIDNTENEFTDDTETIDTCENRPVSRIKVKSFARLTKNDNFIAPCRVCLQDRLYMKVSERPLKYAKVITAVPSLAEFHNLVSGNAPLKLLPKNMTSFDSLQTVNLRS